MTKTAEYVALEDQFGANNYHPLDVVITRGKGVWVWDVDGHKYLDCLSSYSALNQGHVHPAIQKALIQQSRRVTLTSRAFRNDQLAHFYQELCSMTGYEKALPMNSGAEGVETVIKLARKWAYTIKGVPHDQAEIIVADGNFHGRTITLISFSSEPQYKEDFGPYTPGFINVNYGETDAISRAISSNTAAVLLEPIQGEAGVIIPPEGYLHEVKNLCEQNHVLFIADEIQTGLGRTGKLFASEYENVRPDIMIIGKALSGGFYPVSAILADSALLGLFKPGDHGSTFGGNPLAAAVARAALKVIRDESLPERAAEVGGYLMAKLKEIKSPHIREIRGKGLLIGIELKPEAGGARRFCEALMKRGILAKETHQNVIRLAPPLIITRKEIDWAIPKLRRVLMMK